MKHFVLLAALIAFCSCREKRLVAAGRVASKRASESGRVTSVYAGNGTMLNEPYTETTLFLGIESTDTLTFTNRWTNWVEVDAATFNACEVGQIVTIYQ